MARILIVDDEESIQETFSYFLRRASHYVTTVGSVGEAFKALRQERFDLVITDILMPGDTGDVILERIAEEEKPPTVIMVTGQPDLEAMTEMMRRGAYDYLAKPVRKQTLLSTTARALEHRRLALEASVLVKENERYREHLERLVDERTEELDETNRQLMAEIKERKKAEALMARQRDLAVALSRANTQEEALVAFLDAVQALDGVDASCIHIRQDERKDAPFELFMSRNMPANFAEHFHALTPAFSVYHPILAGQVLHSDEISEELHASSRSPNPGLVDHLPAVSLIPVRYNDKTIACLSAASLDSIPAVSKRALEAIAECLGGVITRISLNTALDARNKRDTIEALGISFPPLRSWGGWEWDPDSDSFFWSYSLCRLLVLSYRSRVTPLSEFLEYLRPQDAQTVATLLRNAASGDSEPLTECRLTLCDSIGRQRPALFICRAPLPARPHCMGMFLSLDATDLNAETTYSDTSSPEHTGATPSEPQDS